MLIDTEISHLRNFLDINSAHMGQNDCITINDYIIFLLVMFYAHTFFLKKDNMRLMPDRKRI